MEHQPQFGDRLALASKSSECVCPCGHAFLQASALTKHQCTCLKCKKHLSSALEKAQSLWKGKWRRVLNTVTSASSEDLVAAAQSPLPGLMPTQVLAVEAIEILVEVHISCAIELEDDVHHF